MMCISIEFKCLLRRSSGAVSAADLRDPSRAANIAGNNRLTNDVLRNISNPAMTTFLSNSEAEYLLTWNAASSTGLHNH